MVLQSSSTGIVPLAKYQQLSGGVTAAYLQQNTKSETVFIPSLYEMIGASYSEFNEAEALVAVPGYQPFHYQAYRDGDMLKTFNGAPARWWLRSVYRLFDRSFCNVSPSGGSGGENFAQDPSGVAPCFAL